MLVGFSLLVYPLKVSVCVKYYYFEPFLHRTGHVIILGVKNCLKPINTVAKS